MESVLVQLMQQYEAYRQENSVGLHPESLTGFVLFLNRQMGQTPSNNIDFGIESWKNFDRQTLAEMATSMIGKMNRYVDNYAKRSLPQTMVPSIDEFTYLIVLLGMDSMTKSELIMYNAHQITSGTEIIKRLVRKGYLHEFSNEKDKRSVRVSLTDLGRTAIYSTSTVTKQISELATLKLTDDELMFLVNILKKLDLFHDQLFRNHRQSEVGEVLQLLVKEAYINPV
jgi:DNA-binding MarR family transcriptional regulator